MKIFPDIVFLEIFHDIFSLKIFPNFFSKFVFRIFFSIICFVSTAYCVFMYVVVRWCAAHEKAETVTMTYVPSHLHHMLFELLKVSLVANQTMECSMQHFTR